jgi:hypothetical protein
MQGPDPGAHLPSWWSYEVAASHMDMFLIHGFDRHKARSMKQHQGDLDPSHKCIILHYELTHSWDDGSVVFYMDRLDALPNKGRLINSAGKPVGPVIDISRPDVLNAVQQGVLANLQAGGPGALDGVFNDGEYFLSIDPEQGAPFDRGPAPSSAQIRAYAQQWNRPFISNLTSFLRSKGYPWFVANTATVFAGFPDDSTFALNFGLTSTACYDLLSGSMMEAAFHHYNTPASQPSYDDKRLQLQIQSIDGRINAGKYIWLAVGWSEGSPQSVANLLAWSYGLSQCLNDGQHLLLQFGGYYDQTDLRYVLRNIGQPVPGPAGARGNRNRDGNYDRTFTHARFIVNDSQTRSRPNTTGVGPSMLPRMTAFNHFF